VSWFRRSSSEVKKRCPSGLASKVVSNVHPSFTQRMFVYQWIVRDSNLSDRLDTHFVPLNVREAVAERVKEIHKPSQKT
jgi:hypothetical protein